MLAEGGPRRALGQAGAAIMSNVPAAYDRPFVLLVGVDLADTQSSGFALDQAARVAMRIPTSNMHVIYVMLGKTDLSTTRQEVGLLRHYVSEKAEQLGGLAHMSVGVHLRRGDAAAEIAQLASEIEADVIIVGAHQKLRSLLLGSTSERLMQATKCPVVVAGPRPPVPQSHIIRIEAACPDCLVARAETQGKSWWCKRHSERHLHAHHYSYQSDLPFADHDSEVVPTGTD
jgi:nucleotide-binding universal stress UspA family protein